MARHNSPRDPNADREAERYENPIPSRDYIMEILEGHGAPMPHADLARALAIDDDERLEALRRRLRAMERDGQILRNRKGDYGLISRMDLKRGRVVGHADGFGFLIPDEGGDDVFLSPKAMHPVLHGDRAVVSVIGVDRRGRPEGMVVEVLERNTQQVVGRFFDEGGVGVVEPDNRRLNQEILVAPEEWNGATDGQIVTVEIIEQPSRHRKPLGKVVEILGQHMGAGMEVDVALRAHDIPYEWPAEVEAEAAHFSTEVAEADKEGREDLRDMPLVTIDGSDTKDFDDAVCCEPTRKGWRLVVAIADVAHYVQPDSALDAEALERGNSVYFPNRVVPMLPEVLSNGLCSLNPEVDRLCMAVSVEIDQQGEVLDYRFLEGVMRSHARLTYDEVAGMVQHGDPVVRDQYRHVVKDIDELYRLYQALHQARQRRGAIDFDTTETKIIFGEGSKIDRIVPTERTDAHRMIEEFMLAANTCAADFLEKNRLPTLYRVHESPRKEKLDDLRTVLAERGLKLEGGDKPEAHHVSKLMEQAAGREDFHLIQTLVLRSMNQAIYSPDNQGHFGLGFDAYTHFTSPIRRYPDLIVHRGIRNLLSRQRKPVRDALGKLLKRGVGGDYPYARADMERIGQHSSMTERRADEATRDAEDALKCEYIQDKVGETYEGLVTGVTGFGLFIELKDIYVTGLLHISALDKDYFHFEAAHHRLTGERTGRTYALGDTVKVKVVRVDLDERKIDFELAEPAADKTPSGRRRGGKGGQGKKSEG
ncbi:MAG: ribonuclease R [Thiohalospira sp.]